MYPYARIVIAQHERGLLFKDRSLIAVLEPGVHRVRDPLLRLWIDVRDITEPRFVHPQAEVFAKAMPELMDRHFQAVRLGDGEAGLVFTDGVLADVLAPGTRAFSDPVELDYVSGTDHSDLSGRNLAVSFHAVGATGLMTWHSSAFTTSYLGRPDSGPHSADEDDLALDAAKMFFEERFYDRRFVTFEALCEKRAQGILTSGIGEECQQR